MYNFYRKSQLSYKSNNKLAIQDSQNYCTDFRINSLLTIENVVKICLYQIFSNLMELNDMEKINIGIVKILLHCL